MGSIFGEREDIERAIRLLFRVVFLIGGTLTLMMTFKRLFGMEPGLVSAVIGGGISGALGHLCANGVIALLAVKGPAGGKRRKSTSGKKEAATVKRGKRRSLQPLDDE
jgi:hypothetical protein